jgi:hypothetical protein
MVVAETPNQFSSLLEARHVNPDLFNEALHAYFDIAACSIPILFEDAFWEDYCSGRCSRALSTAVACRGAPFLQTHLDRWDLQQRLACQFQDAIIESEFRLGGNASVRLDDLEAIALMVGFDFSSEYGQPLPSHLAQLLLGHDSLVLMTLESHIKDQHVSSNLATPVESSTLSRSRERQTLLFWHIYGLDAFHILDRKGISRIQDDDAEVTEVLLPMKTEGYLDAVLSLAVVARRIARCTCCGSSKRLGIKYKDLEMIYADLIRWRTACPDHLQVHRGTKSEQVPDTLDQRHNLRRSALKLLELNCYLQIDSCVSKFGLREQDTLDGEAAALRVESETLRAACDVVEVARWAKDTKIRGKNGASYTLIDAAPQMLRNICAGTCFWICQRYESPCRPQSPNTEHAVHPKQSKGGTTSKLLASQQIQTYFDAAIVLREAVASARSHKDTAGRLAQLDQEIERLQGYVNASEQVIQKDGSLPADLTPL